MTTLASEAAATRSAPAFHRLTVAAVERLCDDAAAITFVVPDDLRQAYAFRAGQSLTLRRVIDGCEHRRSYSLCVPVGEPPRIGVREIPGGLFSRWLVRDVVPGVEVEVSTPTGAWDADPAGGERHLCIAAGSGVTPMLSVAGSVLADPRSQVSLIYGNRASRTVMFAEDLGDLKNRHAGQLQAVHVLSREPRDVDRFSGRLDGPRLWRLLTELVPVETFDHVWLCGPLQIVEEARQVLADLQVPADRVHVELFYVDAPPQPRRDPDTPAGATSRLTTVLDGRRTTAAVSRAQTILDGAQATRSDLPFACKGGVCGTCRARLVSGEVRMRRNFALDESELAAGYVLTCQSLPVSDEITVDYDA
jgi:ring-1,2-phenylacetyl-CoA epoxidase subunit PaaE